MSSRKSKRIMNKRAKAPEEPDAGDAQGDMEDSENMRNSVEPSLSFGSQPEGLSQRASLSQGSQGVDPTSMQSATELLDEIKTSRKTRMPTLAQDWVARYEEDEEESMMELCGSLLRAAGCKYEVTPDDLEASQANSGSADLDDLVNRLNNEAASARYPFVVTTGDFKGFKDRFLTFWDKLIRQCSGSVLFDDYFLPQLNNWLSTLSSLKLRPVRHVASALGLQLGSSLIDTHTHLAKRVATTKRQIAKARKKSKKRPQGDPLGKQLERESSQLKLVAGYIEEVFNYALVLRYRDVWAPIRVSCMVALGEWIAKYPELLDTSVKYIGWLLNDKDSKVRIAATRTLVKLFADEDLILQLDDFSEAFGGRIVDLCWDIDISTAVEGISLCGLMAKGEKLEEEDLARIFKLVSDSDKRIREAAAQFIHDVYLGDEEVQPSSTSSPKRNSSKKKTKSVERTPAEKYLLKLVSFVQQHGREGNSASPTLSALLTVRPLDNWEAMTNLMLEDADEVSLEDQTSLAQLMLSAVKQTHSPAKKKALKKTVVAMSDHFAGLIGQLCNRYKADENIAQLLAELPQYLEPSSFQSAQHRRQHKQMVDSLQELFLSHSSHAVLQHCVSSLASLSRAEYAFADQASTALDSIQVSLDEQLELHSQVLQDDEGDEPDEDAQFAIKLCLVRFSELASQRDPQLNSTTYPVVKLALEQVVADVPWICDDSTAQALCRLATMDVLWHLNRAFGDSSDIAGLDLKRDDLLYAMQKILNDSDKSNVIREAAFHCTCDILPLFAHDLRSNEDMSHLRYVAQESLQTGLVTFFHEVMERENDDVETDILQSKVVRGLYTCIKVRALPLRMLADILIYYGEHHAQSAVGKQTKQILGLHRAELTELDLGGNEYRIVLQTLQLAFLNFLAGDRFESDRGELHKVATSLASTYTAATSRKFKELPMSLVLLVQEGIKYGCTEGPKGNVFLNECMIPFCKKTVQPGKILQFFEEQLAERASQPSADDEEQEDDDFEDDLSKFHNALKKNADPEGFKTPATKKTRQRRKAVSPDPRMQLQMESSSGSPSRAKNNSSSSKHQSMSKSSNSDVGTDKRKRAADKKGKEEEEISFSFSVSEAEVVEPPPRRTRKSKPVVNVEPLYSSSEEDNGEEQQESSSLVSPVLRRK